jgi:hypothetical protein
MMLAGRKLPPRCGTCRCRQRTFLRVYFSVVHHPKNHALYESMNMYRKVIGYNDRFFSFTSDMLFNRSKQLNFSPWKDWPAWYEDLYYLQHNI